MSEQPAKANAPRKFAVPSFKDVEAHKRNTEKIQPTNAFLTRGETAVAPAATAPIGVRESNPTQAIPPRAPAQIPLRELNPAQAIPPRAPAQIPLREANPTQTIPPHASAPIPLRELNPTQTIPPRAPAPFVPARLTANASHTITKEKDNTRPGQPNYHYRPKTPNAVIVNSCQRGNPILNSIRNVPYEYGSIVPDYVVGQTACALFLSLKYHRLHPEYVVDRITALGTMYVLRLLMCVVDVETHQEPLRDLNKLCVQAGLTLILAWTPEEAGKYLETFKSYEHKSPDMIRERIDEKGGYLGRLTSVLTSIKSVNKTDVITLSSNFGDSGLATISSSKSNLKVWSATANYKISSATVSMIPVPPVKEMLSCIREMLKDIAAHNLWVNPDCGLRTRGWTETEAIFKNMVAVAYECRKAVACNSNGPVDVAVS